MIFKAVVKDNLRSVVDNGGMVQLGLFAPTDDATNVAVWGDKLPALHIDMALPKELADTFPVGATFNITLESIV